MNGFQIALAAASIIGTGFGLFVALGGIAIEHDMRIAKFGAVVAGVAILPLIILAVVAR